jgi:hypothetical protein
LLERSSDLSSYPDKNGITLNGLDQPASAKPLIAERLVSLVAGDVTGGGGKATTTKT